jgi:hypothetical protein
MNEGAMKTKTKTITKARKLCEPRSATKTVHHLEILYAVAQATWDANEPHGVRLIIDPEVVWDPEALDELASVLPAIKSALNAGRPAQRGERLVKEAGFSVRKLKRQPRERVDHSLAGSSRARVRV